MYSKKYFLKGKNKKNLTIFFDFFTFLRRAVVTNSVFDSVFDSVSKWVQPYTGNELVLPR